MVDNVSDTLRRHAAAMTEQGFPDKAAALSEAADLVEEVGEQEAKATLLARLEAGPKPYGTPDEKTELISFALAWLNYHSR